MQVRLTSTASRRQPVTPRAAAQPRSCARGVKLTTGLVVHMGYSRQWVVDTLRRLGYQQQADEALRVLPEDVDVKQLQEFGDRHGITRDELIGRMGGSP